MDRDEDVVVMGEDVGKNGGVFRATQGLYEEFGDDRVIDTPLAEAGIAGTAIGMAATGCGRCRDAVLRLHVPRVRPDCQPRSPPSDPQSRPLHLPAHRSRTVRRRHPRAGAPLRSTEAFYVHEAGLKVVVPSTPHDTKGLLTAAIRDPDPVIFLEPKLIYRAFRE